MAANESRSLLETTITTLIAYFDQRGITQKQIGILAGRDEPWVSRLTAFGPQGPSLSKLDEIADAFGVPTYMLFLPNDISKLQGSIVELARTRLENIEKGVTGPVNLSSYDPRRKALLADLEATHGTIDLTSGGIERIQPQAATTLRAIIRQTLRDELRSLSAHLRPVRRVQGTTKQQSRASGKHRKAR